MRQFSIVMPVYNKEKYVEKSIESILNQNYRYFELIIIDDGSKDKSSEIIKKIATKDNRIKYVLQKNQGESVARNNGIKIAANEYIAFLDSDDLWLPDFLEVMNRLINQYPDAGAVGCAYFHEPVLENTYIEAMAQVKNKKVIYIKNYFDFVLHHEQHLTASSTIVRRDVFEKVGGFPVGLKNWVDLDLWARIGLFYEIVFTEEKCAIYNDLPDSVSKVSVKLHAPTFDNYQLFMHDSEITKERKKWFKEYVIYEKMYSAYQQYMLDHDGKKAFFELLPYWKTRFNRKSYISMMLQFILSTEKFYKILNLIGKGK